MTVDTFDNDPSQNNTPDPDPVTDPTDITWRQALTTLRTYFVLVLLISLISIIISLPLRSAIISAFPTLQAQPVAEPGPLQVIFYILYDGVTSIVALLFQFAIIHFVAVRTLKGHGTFRGLVHRLTRVLTLQTVVVSVLSLILAFIIGPLVIANGYQTDSRTALAYATTAFIPGVLVIVVVSSGFFLLFCRRLNENYGFSGSRGCVTLVLSTIMILALSFAFNAVILALQLSNMNTPRP